MRLTELEPEWVRYETKADGYNSVREWTIPVNSLSEAQGMWFLCPACFKANNGSVGTHSIDVTFSGRGALDSQGSHGKTDKPTRWNVSGSGFDDLTLAPSILIEGGCKWHGFIVKGEVK
jgi:hypothetical protein